MDIQVLAEDQATLDPETVESRNTDKSFKGCAHCSNTGLEPGICLTEAPACSECEGSPFGDVSST